MNDAGIGPRRGLLSFSAIRKRRRGSAISWFLLLSAGLFTLLLLPGCAGKGKKTAGPDVEAPKEAPHWAVTGNSPNPSGSVCAVGIAGPTFFRFDAVEIACDAARSALARTLKVKIHTTSLDIQTTESGMKDSQTVLEVSSYINDLVLEGSRIVEVWYDEAGTGFARKQNYTYALACIDESAVSSGPASR
jgi:hypothetical protein